MIRHVPDWLVEIDAWPSAEQLFFTNEAKARHLFAVQIWNDQDLSDSYDARLYKRDGETYYEIASAKNEYRRLKAIESKQRHLDISKKKAEFEANPPPQAPKGVDV